LLRNIPVNPNPIPNWLRYIATLALAVCLGAASSAGAEEIAPLLQDGDKAFAKGEFEAAERFFAKAARAEPDNPRILKSLAEAKIKLGKFGEAAALLDQVLAMPVSNGRNVMVFFADDKEPQEAELVDETSVSPGKEKDNMRNYVDVKPPEPIPHYRLFLKKSGEMKLIPKDQVRIKYIGVLRPVYEMAQELKAKAEMELIAASQSAEKDEMVELRGGCFKMGSLKGGADERPVHEVCLSPFKIDAHEVTQKAFQLRMRSNPSHVRGPNLPVEGATWFEAAEYCKKSGKRLPTEAEWEYAARGGAETEYYWGDAFGGKPANFCDKSCVINTDPAAENDGFKQAAPVKSFPPNPFGLYDMAGNVSEWISDWMEERYYEVSPKDNPPGAGLAIDKGIRGGAWNTNPHKLRSAARGNLWPDYRNEGVGFRCAGN
jgi:formylglycine-generating enzyme required for sulfatase activity